MTVKSSKVKLRKARQYVIETLQHAQDEISLTQDPYWQGVKDTCRKVLTILADDVKGPVIILPEQMEEKGG